MNKKGEKYLYIENKSGYSFVLLSIIINGTGLLYSMDRIVVNNQILWYVILNIILTLFIFLDATEQKLYSKKWANVSFLVAAVQILRLFIQPDFKDANTEMIVNITLILSTISLVAGSLITLKKARMREEAASLQTKPAN